MIKKINHRDVWCMECQKETADFQFDTYVICESCLNKNGIISLSDDEKKIIRNNLQYNLTDNPIADRTVKLLERLKNVKCE